MGSKFLLHKFLLLVMISLYVHVVARDHSSMGYHEEERDALYALKRIFDDPFLNSNWSGLQCYMNHPPRWYRIQCVNGRVTGILLENLGLTGTVSSDAFIFLSELTNLSFRNNFLTGNVMNFFANQMLRYLDLSDNMLLGPIPQSLLGLDQLESLQLQDNNLTGHIPRFNQPTLVSFNVSNNNLSRRIPSTEALQSFCPDSFYGNNELCGPPISDSCSSTSKAEYSGSQAPEPPQAASGSTAPIKNSPISHFVAIFLLFVIAALAAAALLFILYYKKVKELKKIKKNTKEQGQGLGDRDVPLEESLTEKTEVVDYSRSVIAEDPRKLIFTDDMVSGFDLGDLLKASAEGLGKGIFGNTYKAIVGDGPEVVVKRLRDLKPMTSEEFTRKLQYLAHQQHPNLLSPLAYYYSKEEKLLLYIYAEKGNLFNRIHGGRGSEERIPFRWNARLSIARGVARALEHLHRTTGLANGIVPHGNLKSTNILLDQNDAVLVSDYGLSSLIAHPIAYQSMTAYKSPEYQATKKISHKADVWNYGTFLMELLTGRVCAASAPPGIQGVELCSWVHRAVREEWTAEIFDMEIIVQRNASPGMMRLLQLAIRCCDKAPEKRPEMTEVVREVESLKEVESEDKDDLSYDRSLTDESASTSVSGSGIVGDDR